MDTEIRRFAVHIREGRCKSCRYCVASCPAQVLSLSGRVNAQGYEVVTPLPDQRCTGCLRCVTICPDFAVVVEPQGR